LRPWRPVNTTQPEQQPPPPKPQDLLRIDVLDNNAGITRDATLRKMFWSSGSRCST
jgi:hypothetical protein